MVDAEVSAEDDVDGGPASAGPVRIDRTCICRVEMRKSMF
jgi:hypothetical protein